MSSKNEIKQELLGSQGTVKSRAALHSPKAILFTAICLSCVGLGLLIAVLITKRHESDALSYSLTFMRDGKEHLNVSSDFKYNYNAAILEKSRDEAYLAVRVQDLKNGAKTSFDVGPSSIILTKIKSWGSNAKNGDSKMVELEEVKKENLIMGPDTCGESAPAQELGAEDPRIFHDHYDTENPEYLLFYTAVTAINDGRDSDLGSVAARLSLASSPTGLPGTWKCHGPVFGEDDTWSKSGALMRSSENPNDFLLLFGDSDIRVVHRTGKYTFEAKNGNSNETSDNDTNIVIGRRSGRWDSALVESGPPPMRLSNGDWLFLYNSAEEAGPSIKPKYSLEYHLGWAVMREVTRDDGLTDLQIVQRSEKPILSPVDWEACNDPNHYSTDPMGTVLTPRVVFVEGAVPYGKPEKVESNRWQENLRVVYQGCDAFLQFGRVIIEYNAGSHVMDEQ